MKYQIRKRHYRLIMIERWEQQVAVADCREWGTQRERWPHQCVTRRITSIKKNVWEYFWILKLINNNDNKYEHIGLFVGICLILETWDHHYRSCRIHATPTTLDRTIGLNTRSHTHTRAHTHDTHTGHQMTRIHFECKYTYTYTYKWKINIYTNDPLKLQYTASIDKK